MRPTRRAVAVGGQGVRRLPVVFLLIVSLAAPRFALAAETYPDKATARIVISQDQQRLLIFDGAILRRAMPISTGWPGQRPTITPPWQGRVGRYWGTFASFGTVQDDGYWLFTDYLPDGRWNGDILLHGAPYTLGPDGAKVYDLSGIGVAPVSHGCIRLLPGDIAWIRAWDPQGVPIEIQPFSDPKQTLTRILAGAALLSLAEIARAR
jgi:lipoprotein-anchoring transpeptidase ErfK/SrfK